MQNVTRKVTLYGKHTGRAVEGFSYWNEEEMKNCSFFADIYYIKMCKYT